jgi:hypothetical protein
LFPHAGCYVKPSSLAPTPSVYKRSTLNSPHLISRLPVSSEYPQQFTPFHILSEPAAWATNLLSLSITTLLGRGSLHTAFKAGALGQRKVLVVVWLQVHSLIVVVHMVIRERFKEVLWGAGGEGGGFWFLSRSEVGLIGAWNCGIRGS